MPTPLPDDKNRQIFPASEKDPLQNYLKYKKVSDKTKDKYLSQFLFLTEPLDSVKTQLEAIKNKRNNGLIMYSTFRHYKACLLYGFSSLVCAHRQPELLGQGENRQTFVNLAVNISDKDALDCYLDVLEWSETAMDLRHERDNISMLTQRSSSHKAKYIDDVVLERLLGAPERYAFLKEFFELNLRVGLRPSEWFHASLVKTSPQFDESWTKYGILPNTNQFWLKVANAKNSFGRACGDYRYIGLDGYGADIIKRINAFLQDIKRTHATAEDFDKFIKTKGKQLSRFLNSDPICRERIRKRSLRVSASAQKKANRRKRMDLQVTPTLYSSRHQAISNARKQGLTHIEIASLFGHNSINTATIHYGHALKGKHGQFKGKPHPDNIGIVIANMTEYQHRLALKDKETMAKKQNQQKNQPSF